jgi:hypothetical protein
MPNAQSKKPSRKKVRATALQRLEQRYFKHFLPLVFSKRRAKEFLSLLGPKTRIWESKKSGKVAIFLERVMHFRTQEV